MPWCSQCRGATRRARCARTCGSQGWARINQGARTLGVRTTRFIGAHEQMCVYYKPRIRGAVCVLCEEPISTEEERDRERGGVRLNGT